MMTSDVAPQSARSGATMFYNWNQWLGQTVDGKFPLIKNLGCSDHSAAFLTERREGDSVRPATIKLIAAPPETSDLQLSRWRLAAGLSHPRVVRLFESGKCDLGDANLLYVVVEYAEENLASVLPERPLAPDETRAMLGAVLEALAYIHGQGFVHGRLRPANIMAQGEELKISSDSLCPAGELRELSGSEDGHTISFADDVWSIGETLVEALTQRPPVVETTEPVHPLVPLNLPEPFNDIARHCLLKDPASRWTIARIVDRLKGRSQAPQVSQKVSQTHTPNQPAETPVDRPYVADWKWNNYGMYVRAALVLAAIVVGPWLFLRHRPTAPAVSPAVPQAAAVQPAPKLQRLVEPSEARPIAPTPPPVSQREERSSVSASPLAVADGSKTPNVESAKAKAGSATVMSATGEVVQRVLPTIPRAARESIHGTVRVTVRVDVDHSGRVEDAEIEAPGPSKYFAELALKAAQRWQFTPPKVAGQNAMSTWALRFEFTRADTTATPAQEIP